MASKLVKAGSKRPRDPPQVKFLINIPLKVESEDEAKKRCGYLLDALSQGFEEEDMKLMNENGRDRLADVAVIFGMNGQHTPELDKVLKKLQTFRYNCKYVDIKYSIITYTWGNDGTIAQNKTETPYQEIREHLKNHTVTKSLVDELRGGNSECLIYFSFVDSDTASFNFIYSEYLQIVREELKKDEIPPTVMSTGYEFTHEKEWHIASHFDRMVRVATAEVEPLFVYYPEPNFCVLVHKKCNTIEESFINTTRKAFESPNLISQVKKRDNFKAVFPDKKPIIIVAPDRFRLRGEGLMINQSTLIPQKWAICAYCNGALTNEEAYTREDGPNDTSSGKKGIVYTNRKFIYDLFNCKDEKEEKKLCEKNPYSMNGKAATKLVEAIKAAKEYRDWLFEFNAKLPAVYNRN